MQDCSISSVLAMEILQSCTKPDIMHVLFSYRLVDRENPRTYFQRLPKSARSFSYRVYNFCIARLCLPECWLDNFIW